METARYPRDLSTLLGAVCTFDSGGSYNQELGPLPPLPEGFPPPSSLNVEAGARKRRDQGHVLPMGKKVSAFTRCFQTPQSCQPQDTGPIFSLPLNLGLTSNHSPPHIIISISFSPISNSSPASARQSEPYSPVCCPRQHALVAHAKSHFKCSTVVRG